MRVPYSGMYSQDGQKGLERSSAEKRKEAAAASRFTLKCGNKK